MIEYLFLKNELKFWTIYKLYQISKLIKDSRLRTSLNHKDLT